MDEGAPALQVRDLFEHVKALDPRVGLDMEETFPLAEDPKKEDLVKWLTTQHPEVAMAIEATEKTWRTAYYFAIDQRANIFALYRRMADLKELLLLHELNSSRPAAYRKPVKTVEWQDDLESFNTGNRETWFHAMEPWTDAFDPVDFHSVETRAVCEEVRDVDTYRTIYHCHGMWAMQQLKDLLERENIQCVALKAHSVKSDLDMLRWKVVSAEEFVQRLPEGQGDRKRRKR